MAKTHPHIDSPSDDQLAALADRVDQGVYDTYREVHRLVISTVPDVRFSLDTIDMSIGYGSKQFGYNGWGMGALSPHRHWVDLVFFNGVALPDPAGLLFGSGVRLRSVKLHSTSDLEDHRPEIVNLLAAAVKVHD